MKELLVLILVALAGGGCTLSGEFSNDNAGKDCKLVASGAEVVLRSVDFSCKGFAPATGGGLPTPSPFTVPAGTQIIPPPSR